MRTEQIYYSRSGSGCGGNIERIEYKCLCGKGKIVEEHDNIPGFRDHYLCINCEECSKKYRLDTSKGVRGWELVERTEK